MLIGLYSTLVPEILKLLHLLSAHLGVKVQTCSFPMGQESSSLRKPKQFYMLMNISEIIAAVICKLLLRHASYFIR